MEGSDSYWIHDFPHHHRDSDVRRVTGGLPEHISFHDLQCSTQFLLRNYDNVSYVNTEWIPFCFGIPNHVLLECLLDDNRTFFKTEEGRDRLARKQQDMQRHTSTNNRTLMNVMFMKQRVNVHLLAPTPNLDDLESHLLAPITFLLVWTGRGAE